MKLTIELMMLFAVLALLSWQVFTAKRRNLKPWLASGLISAANSYYASITRHNNTLRRLVDNNVATRCLLFKKGTSDNSIDICGASDFPLGIVDNTLNAGEPATLELLGRAGSKAMVAAGAIAVGAEVCTAANGQVQAIPATPGTYWIVGTSHTAAANAGDYIEVNDCHPQKIVVS